ncbi:hypothetical protein SAMN05443247_08901 [Bradyrhizobium erythrophlei]|nr:hypothetical protein SAMN05443247_08901 [Bradyrhizobium erythrophlei]
MPNRTKKTEQAYRERALRIIAAENAAAGRKLSPIELAKAVAMKKLAPSTHRQNRAALIFTMIEGAVIRPIRGPVLQKAIALLRGRPAQQEGSSDGGLRTSQQKQKTGVEDDIERICYAALAADGDNATTLVAAIECGALTGARLTEWPSAVFGPSVVPGYAWQLTLSNGKHGNGRAHGETRTLLFESLSDDLVLQMNHWIAVARAAAEDQSYDTLLDTLEAFMRRLTKELFPRRKKRPTLSSMRHAAAARFKATYVVPAATEEEKLHGLAIVAALLGHASDATASTHYARPREGKSRFPVPAPLPAEVARIRQRYSQPRRPSRSGPGTDGPPAR